VTTNPAVERVGRGANPDLPRQEYPRPQFVRGDWFSLNGEWEFQIDQGDSGLERGLLEQPLHQPGGATIRVPFAPESVLSGIGNTDFLEAVWYRRTIDIPLRWTGQQVHLHFQAVDHDATVWVNGVEVARHRGGFTPFTANVSGVARPGERATIVVRARDSRLQFKARGKQSTAYANSSVFYTRTTGIWQTVWLEPVPATHLLRPRITPLVCASAFLVELPLSANRRGWSVRATVGDEHGDIATTEARADQDRTPALLLRLPAERVRLWQPGAGYLYELKLELLDETGRVVDSAGSYAGLRAVTLDGPVLSINGNRVFQRLVLDQGYWPDGIMTAPSDDALVNDIELSMGAGFNGARLHQKVFEERFLYHADRLGYLVWGEFPDWGSFGPDGNDFASSASLVAQWLEALARDYSHPSIIGWCPLNETREPLTDRPGGLDDVTRALFLAARTSDRTRPVLDTSGYAHRVREADVYDSHLYEQDPETFAAQMRPLADGNPYTNPLPDGRPQSVPFAGQPYFCSEFGGIWWDPQTAGSHGRDRAQSWGYGNRPADEEEFYRRFTALVTVLLEDPRMFGYCYTQLTDTFQERNGVYRFDRSAKLDVARLRAAQVRPAAYERS
jgi:beta-galactosidase/beta-glucuronidase